MRYLFLPLLLLLCGCVIQPYGVTPIQQEYVVYDAAPQSVRSVYFEPPVGQPQAVAMGWEPPPLLVEVPPPPPYPGLVWTGGYWTWERGWIWARGRWMAPPRPGYHYVQPYYERRGDVVVFVNAHWAQPQAKFIPPPRSIRIPVEQPAPGAHGERLHGPQGAFTPPPPRTNRDDHAPAEKRNPPPPVYVNASPPHVNAPLPAQVSTTPPAYVNAPPPRVNTAPSRPDAGRPGPVVTTPPPVPPKLPKPADSAPPEKGKPQQPPPGDHKSGRDAARTEPQMRNDAGRGAVTPTKKDATVPVSEPAKKKSQPPVSSPVSGTKPTPKSDKEGTHQSGEKSKHQGQGDKD